MPSVNRRRARRYDIALPVQLPDAEGVTLNVSESGVLFETEAILSTGDALRFSLLFGQFDPLGPFRVVCRGHVVRVERRGSRQAVAVQLEEYGF